MAKISKSKNLSAGVTKKIKKAGMVDPKGAYTKVQERTLGKMKHGGVKKAQNGLPIKNFWASKRLPEQKIGPTSIIEKMDQVSRARREEDMKQKLQRSTAPKIDSLGRPVMKKGGKLKKAQTGITTKRGRDVYNITDTSGYAAGKKGGYPALRITPHLYRASDTTNVTVNRNTIKSAIKKKKP
jgi:hypothetical protein